MTRCNLHYRTSVPVVPATTCRLSNQEKARLDSIAERLLRDEPALKATDAFGSRVRSGLSADPALIIGNSNDIPLVEANTVSLLEYRMSLLGQSGDSFALRGKRCRQFEHYREHQLGLGSLNVIELSGIQPGRQVDLELGSANLDKLVESIRQSISGKHVLNIMPYLGSGSIWALGMRLSIQANTDVNIAAPPPRLTRRINNKLWFADLVAKVLGHFSTPPTRAAYGPAALAGLVMAFAKRYPQVVVKVPDSAGSAGNVKLDSATVLSQPANRTRDSLVTLLRSFGWRDRYPLMVEVWDTNVTSSPSVQMWIPDLAQGPPIVEGVFDQLLHLSAANGEVFAGATKAQLPTLWEVQLIQGAMALGYVLQQLGYFGQLSFDTVLCGENSKQAQLHWIECNGRWGGVSIPMTLMNRLSHRRPGKEFVVIQHDIDVADTMPFNEVLRALDGLLLQPDTNEVGIVLPTPYAAASGTVAQVVACAGSLEAAKAILKEADQRLNRLRES